jgi:hypothetical protein
LNRQQAAWLHQNTDVDTTDLDDYPFSNLVNEFSGAADQLDRMSTILIVCSLIGLIAMVIL